LKPITIEGTDYVFVAPRAGAWIETKILRLKLIFASRAPRGRVD